MGSVTKAAGNGFKWIEDLSKFDEGFIKYYNEKSKEGYFLEVNVQHPEELHDLNTPERMQIEKVETLFANLHDKNEYDIHIRNLKQVLNHGFVLEKVHRAIKLTELREKAKKMILKKTFPS